MELFVFVINSSGFKHRSHVPMWLKQHIVPLKIVVCTFKSVKRLLGVQNNSLVFLEQTSEQFTKKLSGNRKTTESRLPVY
jgi:hypothetical protein